MAKNESTRFIKVSPDLVVWVTTHVQKVVGSNPGAIYWMDIWKFFTLICCKNCIVCLKRPKINYKEALVGPFKKYLELQ